MVYIKQGIEYRRRTDLERPGISHIWLEIKIKGEKKFLLHFHYRQWTLLHKDKANKTIRAQKDRLIRTIESMEKAITEGLEIIHMGDMNIDALTWTDRLITRTDHQKSLASLAELINNRIMDKGCVLINKEPTFNIMNNDIHKPTQVDHIYTNTPNKIISTKTIHNTNSDHSAVSITRSSNQQTNYQNYYITRDYSNFNRTTFNNMIKKTTQNTLSHCP